VSEWSKFLRNLTGNPKWSSKTLSAIIGTGTMDIHHIVKGISAELRAQERLAEQKEQEREEQLAELRQMIDELLAQSAGAEEPSVDA
jgi:hypothetical protein